MGVLKDRKLNVGSAISSETFNKEWPDHMGSSRERIVHMCSPEFGMANFMQGGSAASNFAWPGANDAIAVPFRVTKGMTVYQLGWANGSGTMTDSFDIGIYDASFNRKVSGGGTARSGAAAIQWVDVTDTFLQVGKYFIACSNNGTTANQHRSTNGALGTPMLGMLGMQDTTTASYPLPDPLSGMASAATFTSIPWLAIACRVPF